VSILGTLLFEATYQMHRQVGKLKSGTLRVRNPTTDAYTSVTWGSYYLEPIGEQSALESGGIEPQTAILHLYQVGESTTPRPGDLFREEGVGSDTAAWLVNGIQAHRLNGDTGRAIWDLAVSRMGTGAL
jgi:hypothetical protein